MVGRTSHPSQSEGKMTELNEPLSWLKHEASAMQFGVVMLSVVVHAGKIKRIEKSITHKELIAEENK